MADMYVKGGSLNPFWVDEQIDKAAKREFEEYMGTVSEGLTNTLREVINEFSDEISEYYDEEDDEEEKDEKVNIADELEAKFQFIKRHSDDPEDLALAKKILGID